jgi:hypothetical protein
MSVPSWQAGVSVGAICVPRPALQEATNFPATGVVPAPCGDFVTPARLSTSPVTKPPPGGDNLEREQWATAHVTKSPRRPPGPAPYPARPPPGRARDPAAVYACGMCRNIRTLYNFDPPATDEEIRAAALQYVRKISGFNKPSRANEEAFERALDTVAAASARLLSDLRTTAEPKDREVEAAKARARAAQRYAA